MFNNFLLEINQLSKKVSNQNISFIDASKEIEEYIMNIHDIKPIIAQIGVIPENIEHDSSEEKLFSKASDVVLSRAFLDLGLKSAVLTERGDSADVIAISKYHNYSLVADAKAFRLSRTAKNQKDFKVVALDTWRKDNNYAILVSPYFQYPKSTSQIYQQSVNRNVLLFSWEHILIMLEQNIKESPDISLQELWIWPIILSENITVSDAKKNSIGLFNKYFLNLLDITVEELQSLLVQNIKSLHQRGEVEKTFWKNKIQEIKNMTRDEAINELLAEKKIESKIKTIDKYIGGLNEDRYII